MPNPHKILFALTLALLLPACSSPQPPESASVADTAQAAADTAQAAADAAAAAADADADAEDGHD